MKATFFCYYCWAVILPTCPILAHDNGMISGQIINIVDDMPIIDGIIKLQKTDKIAVSNSAGFFYIKNIPPGNYILETLKPGFTRQLNVCEITAEDKSPVLIIFLTPASDLHQNIFYIGGIEIIAEKELSPEQTLSVTRIQSSEIEHIQATNLGDILDLVPGVEMKNQPNLKEPVWSLLRDPRPTDWASSFGTKIIIDGIPVSNNSNLQAGINSSATSNGIHTSTNTGLDLREIPSDNIQSVEVFRGVAPAQFGDFNGGIVRVQTKASSKSFHRLKFKNNPDTREASLLGAFGVGKTSFDYNLGWGMSNRDIRWENDAYHRVNAQISWRQSCFENKLKLQQHLKFYRTIDEVRIDPTDSSATASYNRGFRLLFGHKGEYRYSKRSAIDYQFFLTYRHINSFKQQRKITALNPISTLPEAGTTEAVIPDNYYLYQQTTNGDEINLGHQITWNRKFFIGTIFHDFSIGEAFQYENNYGHGKQFAILRPPSAGERPRAFNAVPGLSMISIYLSDKITGKLGREYTLDLGVRFESYNPQKLNWPGLFTGESLLPARNGTYVNPRINFIIYGSKSTQFRLGYGASSKAPSLSCVYPEPYYLDVLDLFPVYVNPDSLYYNRNYLISTYIYSRENRYLKAYQTNLFEASLDQRIANWCMTLTGYHSTRKNEPVIQLNPIAYHKYIRPNWPESGGESIEATFIDTYGSFVNAGWSKFSGVEFSLESGLLESLKIRFRMNAAYSYVKSGKDIPDTGNILPNDLILPYYRSHPQWTDKLVLTYQAHYLSKILGIWISLTAQQVPLHRDKQYGANDIYAIGYWDAQQEQFIPIPEDRRQSAEYKDFVLNRDPYSYQLFSRPNKWIFNFKVSKSLGKGAETSFFVNNFFDNRALYKVSRSVYQERNPPIFYGVEFSMLLNNLLSKQ